jgi:hypothetical protein
MAAIAAPAQAQTYWGQGGERHVAQSHRVVHHATVPAFRPVTDWRYGQRHWRHGWHHGYRPWYGDRWRNRWYGDRGRHWGWSDHYRTEWRPHWRNSDWRERRWRHGDWRERHWRHWR